MKSLVLQLDSDIQDVRAQRTSKTAPDRPMCSLRLGSHKLRSTFQSFKDGGNHPKFMPRTETDLTVRTEHSIDDLERVSPLTSRFLPRVMSEHNSRSVLQVAPARSEEDLGPAWLRSGLGSQGQGARRSHRSCL